jgi:hypothetical protein
MDAQDVALRGVGGLLGAVSALAVMLWAYVRRCERYSEKGFGE